MKKVFLVLAGCVLINGCMVASRINVSDVDRVKFNPDNPLIEKRIVFLNGKLNSYSAQAICESLVYLDTQSPTLPIKLVINSGGGDGTAFLSIANMMKSVSAPVDTVNLSVCGSAAVTLYMSATGKRYALKDSTFLIHDFRGQPKEIKDFFSKLQEDILRTKADLPEDWLPLKDKEHYFNAEEAKKYNVAQEIIEQIDL